MAAAVGKFCLGVLAAVYGVAMAARSEGRHQQRTVGSYPDRLQYQPQHNAAPTLNQFDRFLSKVAKRVKVREWVDDPATL